MEALASAVPPDKGKGPAAAADRPGSSAQGGDAANAPGAHATGSAQDKGKRKAAAMEGPSGAAQGDDGGGEPAAAPPDDEGQAAAAGERIRA